nr:MAG TPA: hypothetical protein [Caudoviricetes sp.]
MFSSSMPSSASSSARRAGDSFSSSMPSKALGFSFCAGSSPFSSSTVTPKAFAMGPSIFSGTSPSLFAISARYP